MNLSLIAILLLASVSCQEDTAAASKVQLEQEFKIKIAQEVPVDDLAIRFDSVAHDRRCPCETECSSHRNAAVIFKLESPGSAAKYIVLTALSKPAEIQSRGYMISLLKLDPCPRAHGSYIDPRAYEATLRVTKRQASAAEANGKSQPESKPDLNGKWLHREALDAGSTLTISLAGPALSVTQSRFIRGRDYISQDIYFIDGREHVTTRTEYAQRRPDEPKEDYKTTKVKAVAKWDGEKLVIIDDRGQWEWVLSETGEELIQRAEKRTIVYKRVP